MRADKFNAQNNDQPSGGQESSRSFLPRWLQGRAGLWAALAGGYWLIYASWILFKWGFSEHTALIAGVGYLPTGVFAVVCALYASFHPDVDAKTRKAWRLIALGQALFTLGDGVYLVLDLSIRGVGFPDIPDIFYLTANPLLFWGLIAIPTQLSDPSQKKTWLLDLLVAIVGTGAVIWYFIIAPTALAGGEGWFAQLVAGTYPAMDVLLLASIVSILFRKSDTNTRAAVFILGFGLLLYVAGDLIYAELELLSLYESGSWIDIFWPLAYFIIGLAALRQAHPFPTEQREETEKYRLNWWASAVPLIALILSILVSVYAVITGIGSGFSAQGLLLGTALTILLVTIRQIITVRENGRLVEELNRNASQLQDNADHLARLVKESTQDLETQTARLRKLRLVGEVSRIPVLVRNLDGLLARYSKTILERFNLSRASIYLMDNDREFLLPAFSSTKEDSPTIASDFKFHVEDDGNISQVAATQKPLLFFVSPSNLNPANTHLLPDTQSEMTLPLKLDDETIGVLDLQSDQPQAFDEEDIAIMQIMADQLAAAVERTRLLEQMQQNLNNLEQAYGRFTRESWKSLRESGSLIQAGYRFDNIRIQPIHEVPEASHEALDSGSPVVNNRAASAGKNQVVIPIKLRGQTVGVVSANLKEDYTENTIATLQLAIERLALSLESARLYEEARLRADREQAIAQVATNISSAVEFDAILRTTVEEVGHILGDSEVSIQILSDSQQQDEAQSALNDPERTVEQNVKKQWDEFAAQLKNTAYLFDGARTAPYTPQDPQEKVKRHIQTGRLSLENETEEITLPIRFRGQIVGFLNVKSKKGSRKWTRDELTLLESAAERAALALENARLVESAQRRASRERAIGEISSRIGAVSDVESIMQTAVEELGRRIGGTAEVILELGSERK